MIKLKRYVLPVAAFSVVVFGGLSVQMEKSGVSIKQQNAQAIEHPLSIQLVIDFLNYLYHQNDIPLQYEFPNPSFVNNDETEFNLIVWTDDRWPGGFVYNDFLILSDAAWTWWFDYTFENRWLEIMDKVDTLPSGSSITSSLSGKFNNPAGSTGQYIRGDGSLASLPSIPSAQVNSDWNASSGVAQILNKPSIPTTFDGLNDGSTNVSFTTTLRTKLNGIATGATANDTDANLKNRSNHTGTQAQSTVTNLTTDMANRPVVYQGTTQKSGGILYTNSGTVSSGTVVFHLTSDGTSGGSALCANGPMTSSVNYFVNDALASYQTSLAWTNSNKTATLTVNKLTTANILTGILGQAQANGSTVNFTVWCN